MYPLGKSQSQFEIRSRKIRKRASLQLVLFVPTRLVPYLLGYGTVGFVQKNGEENPLEGPSQPDGSFSFWKAQNAKIICHLGGLLISLECNSVAALAQDYRPLVPL